MNVTSLTDKIRDRIRNEVRQEVNDLMKSWNRDDIADLLTHMTDAEISLIVAQLCRPVEHMNPRKKADLCKIGMIFKKAAERLANQMECLTVESRLEARGLSNETDTTVNSGG